jgi:hypothetical protein
MNRKQSMVPWSCLNLETGEKTMKQHTYLVVGIYEDDQQRFAEDITCESAQDAETIMLVDHPGLIVAGVLQLVKGKIEVIR